MEDDSDSSDIECMLNAVHQKRKKQRLRESQQASSDANGSSSDEYESGSDDDDSDDDVALLKSNRRRGGRDSFDSIGDPLSSSDPIGRKLAAIEQENKVRERARLNRLNAMKKNDDSDSDDDDDNVENNNNVPSEAAVTAVESSSSSSSSKGAATTAAAAAAAAGARGATLRRSSRRAVVDKNKLHITMETTTAEDYAAALTTTNNKKVELDVDDDSSSDDDDDDDDDDVVEIDDNDNPKTKMSAKSNARLESLRQLKETLKGAKRTRSDDIVNSAASQDVVDMTDGGSYYRYITVTVTSSIYKFADNAPFQTQTTTHQIGNYQDLNVLKLSVLEKLSIAPENCVCTLTATTCGITSTKTQTTLLMKKKVSDYKLQDGSHIQATVNLTGLNAFGSSTTTTTGSSSSSSTAVKNTANMGPSIKVTLRPVSGGGGGEKTCKIHMKQPFQDLLDDYVKKAKISDKTKVAFKFDGENLELSKTPQMYDMEDEDLIDVVCLL